MTHHINDYPIIFDRFNELLGPLFQIELTHSMKGLATRGYIVE
jgi:hypothetical protein